MLEQEIDTRIFERQSEEVEVGAIDQQKAEIDTQIEKYQKEYDTQAIQMRKLIASIEEAEANGAINVLDPASSNANNDIMNKLREKV